ncbi:syntaxin-18 isoform X2 [Wyeomyia smithii]|uniref:syntaxin-18 isoform X2 n=1 Tax=Wyeomyia smithii TaxID=174621 RepID=UPI002467BF2B|nr:syntaxin-18 isoform X2 [Wyeomyia smithii]
MDITMLFKASVKTVRLKSSEAFVLRDKSRILQKNNTKLTEKAKQIRFQITELKNLLIENRAAYMQLGQHLKSSEQMSNDERDIIDQESENITKMCMAKLMEFKADCCNAIFSKQMAEFMNLVIETLTNYMSSVHHIANEQQQFRIQQELEMFGLLKLNSDYKLSSIPLNVLGSDSCDEKKLYLKNVSDNVYQSNPRETKLGINLQESDLTNNSWIFENEGLCAEDMQMFESENIQLYSELRGLSEEVERIERHVLDIAHLQQVFTEKISLQKADIDRIANTIVGATENVRDANEQIKQAIQRNAGLRVWVLFFLIIMSLTLLFLDWYNE